MKTKISLNKIDAYIKLKSLFLGKPEIDKIYIASGEIDIKEIKKFLDIQASNIRKFVLNDVNSAKVVFNTDIILNNNLVENYEINGIVKNFYSSSKNINLEKKQVLFT